MIKDKNPTAIQPEPQGVDVSFLCDLESAVRCTFRAGEYLVQQDQPRRYVFYLTEGNGEWLEYTEDGEALYFRSKHAGDTQDVVGLHNLWSPEPLYSYSFVSTSDIVCYRIDEADAREAIHRRPDAMEAVLIMLTRKFQELRKLYNARQSRHISNQVCAYLLDSIVQNANGIRLPKKLTNVSISHRLNVHQVTVAKIMKFLQTEGVISRTADGVRVLNLPRLEEYANGARMAYLSKKTNNKNNQG